MGRWADRLVERLDDVGDREWPRFDVALTKEIGKWIAFRESMREVLIEHHDWSDFDRRYRVHPLSGRISHAFSSLIFGQAPTFEPAKPADDARLEDLLDGNRVTSALQRGVKTSSSEGEVWWRVYVDNEVADVPLVEWYSRTSVIPYFRAGRLRAVAFVTRYDEDEEGKEVFRHFEIHDQGSVYNLLYHGRDKRLGEQADLKQIPETEKLDEEWEHSLPVMLAGWIPNLEGINPTRGVSDYHGIEDFLFDLNESLSVGAENMRLTAKRRMTAPVSALDEQGNLPAGTDIIPVDEDEAALGDASRVGAAYKVLEYSFEAGPLIEYRRSLVEEALSSVGINVQYVGAPTEGSEGLAASGTALRVRLLPTVAAGEERAQFWDDALPQIFRAMQMVDALDVSEGGFGRGWAEKGGEPPAIERGSTLPEDPVEENDRRTSAVAAKIKSRRTAIQEEHPDWSDEEVDKELDRIRGDIADERPSGLGSLFDGSSNPSSRNGTPPEEEEEDESERESEETPEAS